MLHAFLTVKVKIFLSRQELTTNDLQLLEGYTQMRTDFVIQESWPLHASGVDYDEYDRDTDSFYIVAHRSARVVAGLRMTKVENLESSMSYAMWQFCQDRDTFDLQLAKHEREIISMAVNPLWDVTRLVSETAIFNTKDKHSKSFSLIGLYKILAASTTIDTNEEAMWVFTMTAKMYRFMQRTGFEVTILAYGKISSTDTEESYLAVVYPRRALRILKQKKPGLYRLATQTIKQVSN